MTTTGSTEKMETTKDVSQKKLINTNLISLKCLVFFFFGGLGCLFPFLPLHMLKVGLNNGEICMISIIPPAVAILGPLIAGPLADKLAGRQGKNVKPSTGRYLRVMIAVVCILSAILYPLLLLVPTVNRVELSVEMRQRPEAKFTCDHTGATVQQERCKDRTECHRWSDESKVGALLLKNCNYACYPIASRRWHLEIDGPATETTTMVSETNIVDGGSGEATVIPLEPEDFTQEQEETKKVRRYAMLENQPPHLCFKDNDNVVCHVYTEYSGTLAVNASLKHALNPQNKEKWCAYPLADYFTCRIPPALEVSMAELNQTCSIECELIDPYTSAGSVLAESQCQESTDTSELTFWMYICIRSIADIFPTTAVALIDAAVVIATRETSCGRGDVGRQLAFGSLGVALFGPLTGYLTTLVDESAIYYVPIGMHTLMMFLVAIIALSANGMPLSPPEWWWHTRSGMLALPMSAIKRYGSETAALVVVLLIMGTFWSAMDSYLPLHLKRLGGNEFCIGIAMTVGAILSFLFLWKSEHLVDYCGHSNLLITAFTVYILRFTGLSLEGPWWSLISESLEVFTLGIMWVTAILYLRHLVPRHLTVTAQALPVIAHFCVGRCIGAVIGAYINVEEFDVVDSLRFVYRCMAVSAAIIAALYFILYHGLLKPRCHAHTVQGPRQPPTVVQAMNGNGNYTPLRVYHNGMGRKGQFRY